ncbi:MAG: DUF4124 domain-containing protein [Gallionella sp.]|nr:DUF4124 domain-containing protein [Gallionella sp.]
MKLGCLLAIICLSPILAQAEIYKAVDADGHVTYSSTPLKGGKKIILEPLPTMAAPAARARSAATPDDFPKVDGAVQKGRDDTRRKILQDELSSEQKLLEDSRQSLKQGEESPEVYRGQDGKTYRNMARYEEKIRALTEQVDLHQKNIDALKTELSKLK